MAKQIDPFEGVIPKDLTASRPTIGPSLTQRRIQLVQSLTRMPGRSDRVLAAWCGVSRDLVSKIRRNLEEAGCIPIVAERRGFDKKTYKQFSRKEIA